MAISLAAFRRARASLGDPPPPACSVCLTGRGRAFSVVMRAPHCLSVTFRCDGCTHRWVELRRTTGRDRGELFLALVSQKNRVARAALLEAGPDTFDFDDEPVVPQPLLEFSIFPR